MGIVEFNIFWFEFIVKNIYYLTSLNLNLRDNKFDALGAEFIGEEVSKLQNLTYLNLNLGFNVLSHYIIEVGRFYK